MPKKLNIKRVKLKEKLAERIMSGEFAFGERFPGLHQICKEYGTSYVTVNKAMKMLVSEGYLQAKNGVGYFVCYVKSNIVPPCKIVNFITGLKEDSPLWKIIVQGKELFENAGWKVNSFHVPNGDLSTCVPIINSPDAFSLLFFVQPDWKQFTATSQHVAQRVIVIGRLSGNADITSIISDEYETIRRCLEYFRKQNHTRTGIVSNNPGKDVDMLRIAAWRSLMFSHGADIRDFYHHCLAFEKSQMTDNASIRNVYSEWIRQNKGKIDSVIDPFAPQILADVCREQGLRIPEDIAIICIAKEYPIDPAGIIPTLDNNLYQHFQFAFSIMEERYKTGQNPAGSWIFCPPGNFL